MFPAEHARHHDRSVVSRDWHPAALKAAGLRRTIRLHDLRHSAAAARLASGPPMMYVQRQLGHAEVGTTIRVYGHLEESCLVDAAGGRKSPCLGTPTRHSLCPLRSHQPLREPVGHGEW